MKVKLFFWWLLCTWKQQTKIKIPNKFCEIKFTKKKINDTTLHKNYLQCKENKKKKTRSNTWTKKKKCLKTIQQQHWSIKFKYFYEEKTKNKKKKWNENQFTTTEEA